MTTEQTQKYFEQHSDRKGFLREANISLQIVIEDREKTIKRSVLLRLVTRMIAIYMYNGPWSTVESAAHNHHAKSDLKSHLSDILDATPEFYWQKLRQSYLDNVYSIIRYAERKHLLELASLFYVDNQDFPSSSAPEVEQLINNIENRLRSLTNAAMLKIFAYHKCQQLMSAKPKSKAIVNSTIPGTIPVSYSVVMALIADAVDKVAISNKKEQFILFLEQQIVKLRNSK